MSAANIVATSPVMDVPVCVWAGVWECVCVGGCMGVCVWVDGSVGGGIILALRIYIHTG